MLHLFHQGNSRCNDHTRAPEVYIFLRDIYNTDVSNHRQAGFTSHIPCFCPIIFITVPNSSCGKGMFSQACIKNSVHGGGVFQHALGQTPPGRYPSTHWDRHPSYPPPSPGGHCSGRYASYWNAFLFSSILCFITVHWTHASSLNPTLALRLFLLIWLYFASSKLSPTMQYFCMPYHLVNLFFRTDLGVVQATYWKSSAAHGKGVVKSGRPVTAVTGASQNGSSSSSAARQSGSPSHTYKPFVFI